MARAVWADAVDVPGQVCGDARLRDGGKLSTLKYPDGTTHGQAGWDTGIHFTSLDDLATQVTNKFSGGELIRLAIHAHGLTGEFYPAGTTRPDLAVKAETIPRFQAQLMKIGRSTSPKATILIVGCLAGAGMEGTALLKGLSKVWRGREVVGFTTLGYAWGGEQNRKGMGCSEPGMRDTKEHHGTLTNRAQESLQKLWNDLNQLPWASASSPHAKVAVNGIITKSPPEYVPKQRKKKLIQSNKSLYELWKKLKAKRSHELESAYSNLKRELERQENVDYVEPSSLAPNLRRLPKKSQVGSTIWVWGETTEQDKQ